MLTTAVLFPIFFLTCRIMHCYIQKYHITMSFSLLFSVVFIPPTLKKVGGHIASGLSVRSLRLFVMFVCSFITLSGA